MTFTIRFSDEAIDDLEDIEVYVSRDSFAAAERVVAAVHEAVAKLADFPHLGRRGEIKSVHKISVSGLPYLIAYEADAPMDFACLPWRSRFGILVSTFNGQTALRLRHV